MGLVALVIGAFIGNVVIRGLNRAVFGSGDSGPMRWILLVGAIIAASHDGVWGAALFGAWLGCIANGDEQVTR